MMDINLIHDVGSMVGYKYWLELNLDSCFTTVFNVHRSRHADHVLGFEYKNLLHDFKPSFGNEVSEVDIFSFLKVIIITKSTRKYFHYILVFFSSKLYLIEPKRDGYFKPSNCSFLHHEGMTRFSLTVVQPYLLY